MAFHGNATRLVLLTATLLVTAPVVAVAQADYPRRTIKIVVPVPPGPMLDVLLQRSARSSPPDGAAGHHREPSRRRAKPRRRARREGGPRRLHAARNAAGAARDQPAPFPKLAFDPSAFVPDAYSVTMLPPFASSIQSPGDDPVEVIAYAKANPGRDHLRVRRSGQFATSPVTKMSASAGIRLVHVPYQAALGQPYAPI